MIEEGLRSPKGSVRRSLAFAVSVSLGSRITYVILQLAIHATLAKRIGLAGYGQFQVALTWVLVGIALAQFGLHRLPMQVSAVAWANGDERTALHAIGVSWWATLFASSIVTLIVVLALPLLLAWSRLPDVGVALIPLGLIIVPVNLLSVISVVGLVRQDPWPEALSVKVLQPLLFLSYLIGWGAGGQDAFARACWMYFGTWMFALLVGFFVLISRDSSLGLSVALPRSTGAVARGWIRDSIAIHGSDFLYRVRGWLDLLVVGFMFPGIGAGLYAIGSRVAGLLVVFLDSVNTLAASKFAGHLAPEAGSALRNGYQVVTGSVALATGVGAGLLVGGGATILAVFGAEFADAWPILALLACAQFISSAVGPSEYLLFLLGRQADLFRIGLVSAALLVVGASLAGGTGRPALLASASGLALVVHNVLQVRALADRRLFAGYSSLAARSVALFVSVAGLSLLGVAIAPTHLDLTVLAVIGVAALMWLGSGAGRERTLWQKGLLRAL